MQLTNQDISEDLPKRQPWQQYKHGEIHRFYTKSSENPGNGAKRTQL